jgi:hypothetical protein
MDFKTVISILLKHFHDQRVRYGLIGGFALGLWGVGRSTVDLDFLIDRSDIEKIGRIMKEMGYELKFKSENVSQYVSSELLFGELDFLHAFRQASLEMLERADEKEIFNGRFKIKVLQPEDLIGLKLQAVKNNPSRKDSDLADIKALATVRGDLLDWQAVKRYAEILDALDLLKEVREP